MPGAKIPIDWDGMTWKCWVVEWPDSQDWLALLNGFITTPKMGRFWDPDTGSIVGVQSIGVEIWNRNIPNKESLMTCNEETMAFFERMAIALEALVDKPCCPDGGAGSGVFNGGSRGAGITPQIPNGYEDLGIETPPFGFDSYSEFQAHKCNAAHDIVQNTKVDLLSFSNLIPGESTFTAILAGLVGVLLTPIPYDDLAYIVGLLTVGAIEYSFLAQLSTEIQENANDLVCVLYTSDSAPDAQIQYREAIEGIINGMSIITLGKDWLKDIITGMTPMDVFNRLVTDVPTTNQDTDCSECSEAGEYIIELFDPLENGDSGTMDVDGNHYTFTTATNAGREAVNFHAVDPENSAIARCFVISNIVVTGGAHVFYKDNGYICGSEQFSEFASGSLEDAEGLCFHGFLIQFDLGSPGTVEFDAGESCTS